MIAVQNVQKSVHIFDWLFVSGQKRKNTQWLKKFTNISQFQQHRPSITSRSVDHSSDNPRY